MGRWEPDAAGRLREAAIALFGEHGYDQVTVAEIAARAGVTERTFFRHFADKREVLFAGSHLLQDAMVEALDATPADATPLGRVIAAVEAAGGYFTAREFPRQRQAIIDAHPELQERELIKLATLSAALTAALHARGVREPAASLAAEAGIAVFKVAFVRWLADRRRRSFTTLVHESLTELRSVTAAP